MNPIVKRNQDLLEEYMAKEKVVGQSTRKALRLTPMQKKLTQGVRDLIRLYYLIKNNEPFIPVMKGFLKRLQGEDFEYKRETESPIKKLIKERAIPKGDYFVTRSYYPIIHFNHNQKVWFVKIMDLLLESIKERSVDHFYAVKWVHGAVTNMMDSELKRVAPGVIIQEGSPWNISVPKKLINKQVREALRKQESQSQLYPIKGREKEVAVITKPYWEYEVRSDTDFGVALLQGASITYALEHPTWEDDPFRKGLSYGEIPPIILSNWRNYFLGIVRSLLVNYHIAIGNFEYIKICEYDQCNKFFVEKRAGRGHFCSDECMRNSKHGSEKFRCMNRQNTWIRREIPKIMEEIDLVLSTLKDIPIKKIPKYHPKSEYVLEGDCETCRTCRKSGKCTVLIKNNKKVLSIPKKLPFIQKESLNPLVKGKDVLIKINSLFRLPLTPQ